MKKSFQLIVILLMVASAVLAGCAKSENAGSKPSQTNNQQSGSTDAADNSTKEAAKDSNEKVTLTFWNRIQADLFDPSIAGFEKEHPNIKIEMTNLPAGGKDVAQYQAAVSSNELPDIFVRPTGYTIAQLVSIDKVHGLNEIFPKESFDQYTPGTFAEGYGSIGGTVYQFPLYSALHGTMMMFYNKKLLADLGYTEKDIPRTWDELMSFGKEVYKKSNGKVYALTFGPATNYMGTYVVNQLSPPISPKSGFDYTTGRWNWNTPGVIETMEFFKKAYDEKVLHPSTLDADTHKSYALLEGGEALFVFGGNWIGNELNAATAGSDLKLSPDDWDVVPAPTKDGGPSFQYFEGGSGESLYVAKSTKHWPEVKLFLQYLNEHIYGDIVKASGTLPAKNIDVASAEPKYPQYTTVAGIMKQSKMLTPSVYIHNPQAADMMAKFIGYAPHENAGSIFLAYLTGQIKDLPATLQKLTDDNNAALDRAIKESNGTVKPEDFIFPDWVPGQPYQP